MKKIKLYGIGNQEDFNYYIFDKKQFVAEYLSIILNRIFGVYWEFDYEAQKNKKSITKRIDVEKEKDTHVTISAGADIQVNIFYGDKKMFMTINCSQKNKLKFNKELFKVASMPKPKKIN